MTKRFKKKAQKQAKSSQQMNSQRQEATDEVLDLKSRQMQIETDIDFRKLKKDQAGFDFAEVGKGGFQEVLYWSQSAHNPSEIEKITEAFNKQNVVASQYVSYQNFSYFVLNLQAVIYVADGLSPLRTYAFFGFNYAIEDDDFWEKIQFKATKFLPKTRKDQEDLIDIAFFMSRFQKGQEIYNYAEQLLFGKELSIEMIVRLVLIYFNLKKGQQKWIAFLLGSLGNQIQETNHEQLSEVLTAIKRLKKIPSNLKEAIISRSKDILDNCDLLQCLKISEYFGYELKSPQTWVRLEARISSLLEDNAIDSQLLGLFIDATLLTYNYSVKFIEEYVMKVLRFDEMKLLREAEPRLLAGISKGLFMMEMEKSSVDILICIEQVIISKITRGINEIKDQDLLEVIKDFNVTRHGNRQLYIFFEEVVNLKYVKFYSPQLSRRTVQALITIYENSGMCSQRLLNSLKALL